MTEMPSWKCAKWPFIAAWLILLGLGFALVWNSPHPIAMAEIYLVTGCVVLGSLVACIPFYLDYRAVGKMIEVHAVGEVVEKIQDLHRASEQISTATDQWARVQETTKGHAEKTVAAAAEIAGRMTSEVREFSEFQAKMNDSEKNALRLETEKLRRAEGEWLQVVARIMDHTFALHTAAIRSGQPELAEQIGNFQNACRDAARRVGFIPFGVDAGEKFDAEKHRAHGNETPDAGATVSELLATGISFQGRILRPALVRLQNAGAVTTTEAAASEKPVEPSESGQLTLETN